MTKPSARFGDLSPREARILSALLEGATNEQVGKSFGVARSVISRLRLSPRFRKHLSAEVRGIIENTRNRLFMAINPALRALVEVVQNQSNGPVARVTAAGSILNNAFKAAELCSKISEIDIRQELDAIYELLDEKPAHRQMKVSLDDSPSPN